ncbi:MAG: cyclase family protein [Acidobacteriota bacterium]
MRLSACCACRPFARARIVSPGRYGAICFGCAIVPVLALLLGCVASPGIDESRLVDLTYPLGDETLYWPTAAPFRLEIKSAERTPAGYWYAANNFSTAEHVGTHLDAPYHFAQAGQKAGEIPLSRFIGPACVLDVSQKAQADADYRATVADLEAWEARHGTLPEGAILLVRTGWGRYWGDRLAYFGDDTPGDASNLHFPGLSRELAELLASERSVDAVGIDSASIDHGPSTDFIVHQVLFEAGIPAFENLASLERLPEAGATVIALPARIEAGSGAPLRAVALLP